MAESLTTNVVSKCFNVIAEFLDSKYGKGLYKINSFSLQPGCSIGENFLGAIFSSKFSITLSDKGKREKKEFDLVLKSQLLTESSNSSAKYFWNIMFTKEKMIYTDIMEKLEEMDHQAGKLCPKLHHFFSEGEDYSCLVLDNLISLGYHIPKSTNLTFDECKTIMKHLARLHSLSLVLEATNGRSIPESYEFCGAELFFSSSMEYVFRSYVQNSFNGILQACEKMRPDLVAPLKKFNQDETVWKRGCQLVRPGTTSFNCVCHGDPRLGNIFLKKKATCNSSTSSSPAAPQEEDDEDISLRFIDFQLTRYSSPISDLIYTLYVGTTKKFRDQYMTQLLHEYHKEFQFTLSRFPRVQLKPEVTNWTLDKLLSEFQQFNSYALVVSIVFLPVILLRPTDLDSSVADMSPEEREEFLVSNRANIIAKVLPANQEMRDRILEILDEFLL